MRRRILFIIAGVVLALIVIVSYSGSPGKEGATGTFSCSSPVGPGDPEKKEYSPATADSPIKGDRIQVLLLVGNVGYDEEVGGSRWRATFEVKVFLPTEENIASQSDIDFYSIKKATRPSSDDSGWAPIVDAEGNLSGLTSIGGIWFDSPESSNELLVWVKAYIINNFYHLDFDVIGKTEFREDEEKPTARWIRGQDYSYGGGNRVLSSEEFIVH